MKKHTIYTEFIPNFDDRFRGEVPSLTKSSASGKAFSYGNRDGEFENLFVNGKQFKKNYKEIIVAMAGAKYLESIKDVPLEEADEKLCFAVISSVLDEDNLMANNAYSTAVYDGTIARALNRLAAIDDISNINRLIFTSMTKGKKQRHEVVIDLKDQVYSVDNEGVKSDLIALSDERITCLRELVKIPHNWKREYVRVFPRGNGNHRWEMKIGSKTVSGINCYPCNYDYFSKKLVEIIPELSGFPFSF